MSLSLGVPKTVGNGGLAGEYLATGTNSGVFMDIIPYTFGSTGTPHSGVAFFCDGVPTNAPDNQPWAGKARGVTFYPGPGRKIMWEDWKGGADNQESYDSGSTWEPNVIYRITATYMTSGVNLSVYKTDNANNVVALVASSVRSSPGSKGTHACVFATDGSYVGCCPIALYP